MIPTDPKVKVFLSLRMTGASAFGAKVESSKNSIPVSTTVTSSISPISGPFTFNRAFFPVVVPIDVTTGIFLIVYPGFTISTEWIPPLSFKELV